MVAVHVSNANVTKQGDPGFGGEQAGWYESSRMYLFMCMCVIRS